LVSSDLSCGTCSVTLNADVTSSISITCAIAARSRNPRVADHQRGPN
jgi:hypothetical protein